MLYNWNNMAEIILSSIENIRDLGGIKAAEGKRIRENRLIRSAKLTKASADDLSYLRKVHHLDTVLDIRSPEEIGKEPDQTGDLNYLNIPVFIRYRNSIGEEQILAHDLPDPVEFMKDTYVQLISDPEYVEGIRKIIIAIIEHTKKEGAILWHCSEGKDRCGLISAIVLKMLGVSDEEIMKDYILTNRTAIPRAKEALEQLKPKIGKETVEKLYPAAIANETYLKAAMEKMGDDYARDVLKIDPAAIEWFKNDILE